MSTPANVDPAGRETRGEERDLDRITAHTMDGEKAGTSSAPLASVGERGLIEIIRRRFPAPAGLLHVGIGDDGAVAAPERGALQVLTTDALVESVHFDLAFSSLFDVGYKALAVNVSDVAAMGGRARLALLSLMLPSSLAITDVEAILDGFEHMAREAGVTLAGGNITVSPGPLIVDVTVVGSVKPRKFLTRAGGRPGDALYVTGTIGAASAGLGWLRQWSAEERTRQDNGAIDECVRRYRRPVPRYRIGMLLGRTRSATACMDLSDGLADSISQLAAASGTGARVDAALLPICDPARRWYASQGTDPVRGALAGGDDYELLFSVPPRQRGSLRTVLRQSGGVPLTRIGELTASPAVVLVRDSTEEPLPQGFVHF